eukprot:3040198-Lingulodinium_polyedra.AAC.1
MGPTRCACGHPAQRGAPPDAKSLTTAFVSHSCDPARTAPSRGRQCCFGQPVFLVSRFVV